jgi:hypothetical protein
LICEKKNNIALVEKISTNKDGTLFLERFVRLGFAKVSELILLAILALLLQYLIFNNF